MKKRILGKTNLKISEIAFGGVEIGMPYGIGIQSEGDMLSPDDAVRLLHASLDAGINFFDTARMYGNSETLMGKAFHDRRDKVVISTKCRHFRNSTGSLPPEQELKSFITSSLQESLAELKTDYVDLFMLHQADPEILNNETIAGEFQSLKSKGLVRSVGASTYSLEESETAIRSGIWEVVQTPFNLIDQRQGEIFGLAEKYQVGIVVRSVLLKGLLSERGKNLHKELRPVEEHSKGYVPFLNEEIPDLPTLAVKFALSFDQISSVLIGMDKQEYLKKSLAIADNSYFDKPLLSSLTKMAYPDPTFINLPYWSRMGWLV